MLTLGWQSSVNRQPHSAWSSWFSDASGLYKTALKPYSLFALSSSLLPPWAWSPLPAYYRVYQCTSYLIPFIHGECQRRRVRFSVRLLSPFHHGLLTNSLRVQCHASIQACSIWLHVTLSLDVDGCVSPRHEPLN